MNRGKRPELLWGLGLSDAEKNQIQSALGPEFFLRNFPPNRLPWSKDMSGKEKPSVAWIPQRVWSRIPEFRKDAYQELEDTQRILIQNDEDDNLSMEKILGDGFFTVVKSPLTKTKVQEAIFKAKEVTSLYDDIYRMTQEIILERELLARKTDQLMFLNKILTKATETLNTDEILMNARKDLAMLLPLHSLHAAFWNMEQEEKLEVDVYVQGKMDKKTKEEWTEYILNQAPKFAGRSVDVYSTTHLVPTGKKTVAPGTGRMITLPFKSGKDNFGVLVMQCDPKTRLAKDEIQTLQSAVSHLSLALRNSRLFNKVEIKASRDGLTKIYNRGTFNEKFVQELMRHRRYGYELSVLMLDLDFFKKINDTFGHQAGDEVLKQTAQALKSSLRNTDIAARYGGEEFVVLLPHTNKDDAWKLAERIRAKVAEMRFKFDGSGASITCSIGVASMHPGCLLKEEELLEQADKALYQAKQGGRNMVAIAGQEEPCQEAQ